MDWAALILGAAGGLITATITAIIAWRRLRPDIEKTEAETTKLVGQAWLDLLASMRQELESLRLRVTLMEAEIKNRDEQRDQDRKRIKELEDEVAILKQQLRELGHKPRTLKGE